jgi:hypothetical protein
MALWLALSLVVQAQDPSRSVAGRGGPAVEVPRIEAQAIIDGQLDEPAWNQAVRLVGFSQYEPVDGRPAEERTDVRVWYGPDAIYFGIEAYDREPAAIRATHADRDNIDNDDHVIIYLDTFNDRRRAFFFGVNALGVQQDGVRSEGAASAGMMFGGNIDRNPDFYYESHGRLSDQGYVVEVRIPFKSLRYDGNGPQQWGINVLRQVKRTGYTDTWTDVRRASNSFLIQAGTLTGLHDLHRGVVLEAQPFFTATANGERAATDAQFRRDAVDPDAGLNLRVGFTSLSLDATLNPDFSQVESDVGQVTVNERFALFFPEKRPFFLENIDLFAAPNQLVYTRRVVDPRAGMKLTGKLGPLAVAQLTAVDQGADGAPDALFNVTRVRTDFGSNSLAGMVLTDRSELDGPGYNRVLAGDMRLTFARLYYFEAQAGRSWTRAAGGSNSAPIWKLAVDRTGRRLGFNYSINAVGRDFQAQAGFVPRNDIVDAHAFNRLAFYGERGAALESFTIFGGPTRIWRYDDFTRRDAIEGGESLDATLRLRGGWQVSANLARNFVALEPAAYADYQTQAPGGAAAPYQPLDEVSGPSTRLRLTSPTFQGLSATASVQRQRAALFAEGSEGNALNLSVDLTLRPTEFLRVQLLDTWQRLTRKRDDSEFAITHIPRIKLEVQPSRPLFFRVIGEYRAQRTAALEDARTGLPLLLNGVPIAGLRTAGLRLDFLASFEPSPGTVAFLGYGSALATPGTLEFGDLNRVADGFFLKLAYQLRR